MRGLRRKRFNHLPDDKILALSKLKTTASDELNFTQNIKFVFLRVQNNVDKGEKEEKKKKKKKLRVTCIFSFSNNVF